MPRPTPKLATVSSMWEFIRAFLDDRQKIGAVAPTSAGVGRNMARLGKVGDAKRVVEFGPGTGAITTQLLAALPSDGRLWAFEIYEPFLEKLRETIHDPRLTLLGQSAEAVRELRAVEAPEGFDAIICSIPFSLLPPAVTSGILAAAAESLRPGGLFVALQYHPTYLPPILRQHFQHVSREWFPWNIPPTFLLTARDPRSTS
jgi:phosphatidylethanolamine/phosphatidyl-N-methylethanolamine N-methyltransferase